MKHFSEADLLETYYTQPGESMPVMMHLAECHDCAARYERLERKLREAAACNTEKPATFWQRQRLQIMRGVDAKRTSAASVARTLRVAAAAILAFFLGGAVVYETVRPVQQPRPSVGTRVGTVSGHAPIVKGDASTKVAIAPVHDASDLHDAWQSDELKDFHSVVEWEAWVPDNQTTTTKGSSL